MLVAGETFTIFLLTGISNYNIFLIITIAQTQGIVSFAEANEISIGPKQSDYTVGGQWN